MSLSSISINRPVLATVISIVIVLFGVIGYTYLGVREFPSVDPPIVTVTTNYAGANADIIESQITEPLEESINGIAGISTLTSTSSDGRSTITVEFELGIGMDAAANDVRDRVSRAVRNLPPDSDPPIVVKSDANAETILSITVQSDKRTLLQLTDIGINIFKERLQTIPGVSEIRIWGEKKYSMRLEMDPKKITAYALTPLDVRNALLAQNVELPSGRIEGYEKEMIIRTFGRLTTEEEFNNMIISESGNTLVRFKDIGRARLAPENERTLLRGDGGIPMIGVALTPQPGANYIEIVDEAYKRVEQIKKELPEDIIVGVALDTTTTIRKAISEVRDTIMIAFSLVVIIIFIFLRNWRTTLIPVITIPISLVGSFFIMYISDFSINILTLLGIVLATGIVVDDAIVMMENIYSKIEKGMDPIEAGHKGAGEIFFAIVSTTVTLCAVFLPIIFLEGLTGRLFREFGIVVGGAVIISTIVSLTLTPMLSSRILKQKKNPGSLFLATERFFERMTESYNSSLTRFMKHPWIALIMIALAMGIIFGIGSQIPSELAPMEDKSRLRIMSTAPEGTSFEKMDEFTMEIVSLVDTMSEKASLLSVTSPGFGASVSTNNSFVRLNLVPPNERSRSQDEIARMLNMKLREYNFARAFVVQEQTIATGGGLRGLPLQYVLQSPNLDMLRKALPEFLEKARANPAFEVVDFDLKFNKPELKLSINREKAREMGVEVIDVAETLQLLFSGQRFGFFIYNGKQYQVIGQASRDNRNEIQDLASVTVKNKLNELVRLDNIVTMEEISSPPQLYRYNRYVSATVSAQPAKGVTLGQGIDEMDKIAKEVLDETFSTSLTGSSKDFAESSSSLMFAFIFALALIYLTLAAQFESFRDPLIIMVTVPLALAGAVITLWLTGHTFNIFSQIGIIVLIGIVTKNGILIVEFANQRRIAGLNHLDAVIDASTQRFRPIMMTSFATILGATPIAFAFGDAATSRIPMGVAIIGGLLFSLGLTLYVIPALYVYFEKLMRFIYRILGIGKSAALLIMIPVLLFIIPQNGIAQTLTFETAVQEMLAKNFDIRIESNNQAIASELNHIGNAGFLPTVDATFGYDKSYSNTNQTFLDGREDNRRNAQRDNIFAGVTLNWTLFDGFRMFAMKDILNANETLSGHYLRAASEEALLLLGSLYYQIVQLQKQVEIFEQALSITKERQRLAERRLEIGSGSRQEVLQALIDVNNDSISLMEISVNISNLKTEMNLLLARDLIDAIEVAQEIPLQENLSLSALMESAGKANVDLLIARENIRVAQGETKLSRATLYPQAGVFAGYDFVKVTSEAGFLRSNRSYGPHVGVFVNYNLFNGLRDFKNLEVSKLQEINSRISNEKAGYLNTAQILKSYRLYEVAKNMLAMEKISVEQAEENLKIALRKFELGAITSVEFRDIQLQLIRSQSNILNAQFEIRMQELELKRLAGVVMM